MKKTLIFILSILITLTTNITTVSADYISANNLYLNDGILYISQNYSTNNEYIAQHALYFYNGKLYTKNDYTEEFTGYGAYWSGDASTNTLTLNDKFHFKTYESVALYLPANATLVINGNVTIKSIYKSGTTQTGIKTLAATSADDTLTIKGSGRLELVSPGCNIESFIDVQNLVLDNANIVTHSIKAARDIEIKGGVLICDYIKAGRDLSIKKGTTNGSVLIADYYKGLINTVADRGINAVGDISIDNGETFVISSTSDAISAGGKLTIGSKANVVASSVKDGNKAISATTYDLKAPDFAGTNSSITDLISYNSNDNSSYNFYCTNPIKANNKYYAAKITSDYELQYILTHFGSCYLNNDIVTNFDVNELAYDNVDNDLYNVYQVKSINILLNDHILDLNNKCNITVHHANFSIDDNGNSVHYFYDSNSDKCYETYSTSKPNGVGNIIVTKGGVITGGNNPINVTENVTISNCNIVGFNSNINGGALISSYGSIVDLNNVLIAGNCSSGTGGAILTGGAQINFNSGEIAYNYSGTNGGAVDCSSGSFNMYSGNIHNNFSSSNGGAIYNDVQAVSFHMHGGTIENNYAEGYGGGVYDGKNDISFDGVCVVKNNTAGHGASKNITDNVYTKGNFTIGLSGSPTVLSDESYIGITKSSGYGEFTTGTYLTPSTKYFVSDSPLYLVKTTTDNNVELTKNYHVSKIDNNVISTKLDGYDKDTALYIMNGDSSYTYADNDIIAYQTNGTKYNVLIYQSGWWYEDTNTYNLSDLDYVLGTVVNGNYYLINKDAGDVSIDTSGNGYKEFYKGKTTDCTLHIKGFSLVNNIPDDVVVRCGGRVLDKDTDFSLVDGSLKVVFDNSFVKTLPVGLNNIFVDVYKNGLIYSFNLKIKIIDTNSSSVNSSYQVVNTSVY